MTEDQIQQIATFCRQHPGPFRLELYRLDCSTPGVEYEHSRRVFAGLSMAGVLAAASACRGLGMSFRLRSHNCHRLDVETPTYSRATTTAQRLYTDGGPGEGDGIFPRLPSSSVR